jgi:broad-specificity NMP kinase
MKVGKIIGLYSPVPQSGKTTIAKELELNSDYNFQRVSCADPIRELGVLLLEMLGHPQRIAVEMFHYNKETPMASLGGHTPRHLLQTLGQEWGRTHIDENLWAKILEHKIFELTQDGIDVVVDDIRYENEADVIRKLGGKVVKVFRPSAIESYKGDHGSEGNLEGAGKVDHVVYNGSTVDTAVGQVFELIGGVGGEW